MKSRSRDVFTTVRTEGGLLPADILARLRAGDRAVEGLSRDAYHLVAGERIGEAATRAWNRLSAAWPPFRDAALRLPANDPGTGLTRERWLLILFQELGYGRLAPARAVEIDGKPYPISHFSYNVPIHLVGWNVEIDRRTAGVAGAARMSPHGLLQEYLNRSDSLWGFVSNGRRLRILRDSSSLTRQAYVEFDLEGLMEGEIYPDFVLLWLLCHQSRVEGEKPEDCWLERWTKHAREQGTRALDTLRAGVEEAIKALGSGFLAHRSNNALRERLRAGALSPQDYYRQLLRLVYRLLFLFVAEDRELLLDRSAGSAPHERFSRYYSTARLRHLAERRRGTDHVDLFRALSLVMEKLGSDEGCPALALPALGSFLWSTEAVVDLASCDIANRDLLAAVHALAFTVQDNATRAVDYKNLGTEELGSIYESLLELHPEIHAEAATFELKTASGHERKTTGSYYTPASLIQCLLDSALDPVLDEAARKPDPERAILSLKVCDPACGSGHFLIAAAHRMAKRLATIRTGDEEPSPEAVRSALRDVIAHTIHGVDLNPMAVELCKVSLWLEALEPGKPLAFLEHRILCGNSLIGATPTLLDGGIPDDAFKPIEGDDKRFAGALAKKNRQERKDAERGQLTLALVVEPPKYAAIAQSLAAIDAVADGSIAGIHEKESRLRRLAGSPEYKRERLAADAWCAAFVWKKTKDALPAITQETFFRIREDPDRVPLAVREEVARLANQYQFLHWHLAFPDVFSVPAEGEPESAQAGWSGGFDAMLGNPPWEQIQLDPREFFAESAPEIVAAQHMAARDRAISALAKTDPRLHGRYVDALREMEGIQQFIHASGRFPLTEYGRLNSAPLFAELARAVVSPMGRVGLILPSGIATDSFNQYFFRSLMESRALGTLYDFQNLKGLFPAVERNKKFSLVTVTGPACGRPQYCQFVFFALCIEDLRDEWRRVTLSAEDIALLNPNTRTCPVFRSKRDAEITKAIYRRVPVLVNETMGEAGNPWGFQGLLMFMMNTASVLFRTREQLEADEWTLEGNKFRKGVERYLPLYEAKLIHHFDHRLNTFDGVPPEKRFSVKAPGIPFRGRHADAFAVPIPRYWVPEAEVEERLSGKWDRGWLLGWRDVTNVTTNRRTVIATVLPRVGVGHTCPVFLFGTIAPRKAALLLANLCALALDFPARQKIGGNHLTYGYLNQLPVLPPSTYSDRVPWSLGQALCDWLLPRVLELTYTSWDLEPFARDCGYDGPPFRWDEDRRFLLRCELDAAFFHLYGIPRDDVDYIMETFPIVKQKDEAAHGEYRTKRVILEIYDAMQKAIEAGVAYRTLLDPPAADPRVAHPARESVRALLFRRVEPREEDKYQTCVPIFSLKAAAGAFSEGQSVEPEGWAEISTTRTLRPGMFVAQVVGRSMEPLIPDGSWCLFQSPVTGSRQGRILLVQHHDIHDPETGGSYTVKRYRSEKTATPDGSWRHASIWLEPVNPHYDPIAINDRDDAVRVAAEFLELLNAG